MHKTTHAYAPEEEKSAYADFLAAYPDYRNTRLLSQWRTTEYRRLDERGQTYLDYTGGGLYAESQLQQHFELLRGQVFGNPHSINPASLAMTELVEDARRYVLAYFNASPDEYFAVFTANASGALKLVGEAYPFAPGGQFLLTFDNHNSVNGIREFAKAKGASITYIPLVPPELRVDRAQLDHHLNQADAHQHNLFAFPAQSNFSGVKHPLEWVGLAQEKGWDVLLDAAAFVPTNHLDLGICKPEFVCMSFYKMFGYPTGLGALLMRKSAFKKLVRPWFAGGTVNFASVQARGHYLTPNEAAYEDGTVNYLSIPAIKIGLQHLEKAGVEMIQTRVQCLTGWLLENLLSLTHDNGKPLVRLYGPANTRMRGGTITLNFYSPDGHLLDYRRIEELATEDGISIRSGCFCNPGAGEIAEGLTEADMRAGLEESAQMTLPRFLEMIQHRSHKSAGAIRISVGLASNFSDVYRFMRFAAALRNTTNLILGEATFDIAGCRAVRDAT